MTEDHLCRFSLADAIDDLKRRTLAAFPGDLGKLVYLASTRENCSGRYCHEGLAMRFNLELAEAAIACCHCEIFERTVSASLENLVRELKSLFACTDPLEEPWRCGEKLSPTMLWFPKNPTSSQEGFLFRTLGWR